MNRLSTQDLFTLKDAARTVQTSDAPDAPQTLAMSTVSDVAYSASQGIIKGYASTFDEFDYYNDVIRSGAFERSISENFRGMETPRIKVLNMHSWSAPIGLPTVMREDSKGLYVEASITDQTEAGRQARVLAELGLMDGLSIGFRHVKGGYRELGEDEFDPEALKGSLWMWPTEITDLDMHEFSLVTFPANWGARVEAVKSMGQIIGRGWRSEEPSAQSDDDETPETAPEEKAPEPVPTIDPESVRSAFVAVRRKEQIRQAFARLDN